MKDLIVLTADLDMNLYVESILKRIPSVYSTREFTFDIRRHMQRDAGCRTQGCSFLQAFIHQYRYAIIMFDHEGCGKESTPREGLEEELESALNNNGWLNRSCCIVIEPELENWVWINSPHVADAINWKKPNQSPYQWLEEQGLKDPHALKPHHPKEAMEMALKETNKRISASIYQQIASTASFRRCTDAAFIKFTGALRDWFRSSNDSHSIITNL